MGFVDIFRNTGFCYSAVSVFVLLCLGACATPNTFPYAGVGYGASKLELDTAETNLALERTDDTAATVVLGIDVSSRLSVEASYSDLGAAELSSGSEVGYSTASLSGTARVRPGRNGFNAYARLGVGALRNKEPENSEIRIETRNATHLVTGLGIEYNFQSGLTVRAEATGHDADAQHADISLLYRFGPTAEQRAGEPWVLTPVQPDLRQSESVQTESVQSGLQQSDSTSTAIATVVAPRPSDLSAETIRVQPQIQPPASSSPLDSRARDAELLHQRLDIKPLPEIMMQSAPGGRPSAIPVFESVGPGAAEIPEVETAESAKVLAELGVDLSIKTTVPKVRAPEPAPMDVEPASGHTDADGVFDSLDKCDATPATVPIGSDGCYRYDGYLPGVEFESGTDNLTANGRSILDAVALDMKRFSNSGMHIQVSASDLSAASLLMARKRTLSVIRYLVAAGIKGTRLKPAAPLKRETSSASSSTEVHLRALPG